MTLVRTLIVDDEQVARTGLHSLLEEEPEIDVIGACSNGMQAVAALRDLEPDLVFLDVQMPEMSGFDVIEQVGIAQMPTVIFVTAYDQYALQAFEVHALDYLLKPFNRTRLQKALARAIPHIKRQRADDLEDRLHRLLRASHKAEDAPPAYVERLVVRSAGYLFFLNVEEIDWIEAAGNYVRLHVGGKTHLLRDTMGAMEARLDPDVFLRIHRSAIVNARRIRRLQPLQNSDYVVLLDEGTELTCSRRYRKNLDVLLDT